MQTNELNMLIFWVCVAIGALVYAGIIWSLLAYRKTRQDEDPAFHKHTMVEIAWTVIPLIIIIAMTMPAARLLTRLYGDGDERSGMIYIETDARYPNALARADAENVARIHAG